MMTIFPRTASETRDRERASRPLAECRDYPAYVLLGEPGAGKSEAFKQEAQAGGKPITARDFVLLGVDPEWQGETLFIDGLDELRAEEGRSALSQIRKKLNELGSPRFRLSCREADWLGASDAEDLNSVAPGGRIVTLHLDPLDNTLIADILRANHGVSDTDTFLGKAHAQGVEDLLRNPLMLGLLAEAVRENDWPDSRARLYQLACEKLLWEANPRHRNARRGQQRNQAALLDAAGHLDAILLLADLSGYALDAGAADATHPALESLAPPALPLEEALKTRLFQGEHENMRRPLHRSVAEYLAARYLAKLVDERHLPIGRLLALMTGHDGGVVPTLRGLYAWLAVHCHTARARLIESDPLGVVLYGDVRGYSPEDKRRVLHGLELAAKEYTHFRFENWSSHPFGALATPDMEAEFLTILMDPDRSEAHQELVLCVLDALQHGQTMSALTNTLDAVVRDQGALSTVRNDALSALTRLPDAQLLPLLEDIHTGKVEDTADELTGILLRKLYPNQLPPEELLRHLHAPRRDSYTGMYRWFWTHELSRLTEDDALPILLDGLAAIPPQDKGCHDVIRDFARIAGGLLVRGLETHGQAITDERLFAWLGIGLDEYDSTCLEKADAERIADWLSSRTDRYKAILGLALEHCLGQENPIGCMYGSGDRLYGAESPGDLGLWHLDRALSAKEEPLAQFHFQEAAACLIGGNGLGLTMEALEDWVTTHPRFRPWFDAMMVCTGYEKRNEIKQQHAQRRADKAAQKRAWITSFRSHFPALRDGSAPPGVLYSLAQAYLGHAIEAPGDSPRERLGNFLDGEQGLVEVALEGLRKSLERSDLPEPKDIITLAREGRTYLTSLACEAGVRELTQSDPASVLKLDDGVLRRLLAFHLTRLDNNPDWFITLATHRASLVAEMLLTCAIPTLKAGGNLVPQVHMLARDNALAEVARMALPSLLERFPLRARGRQLTDLEELLKGGVRLLGPSGMLLLIEQRLSQPKLDVGQRVYWLAAGLLADPGSYEQSLAQYLGSSQTRASHLGNFLHNRLGMGGITQDFPLSSTVLLIELLAPGCTPDRPTGAHWVTPAMNTADLVRALIQRLGTTPGTASAQALERLLGLSQLKHWHSALRHARQTQRITWRREAFRHASVAEVEATLANLQPANHADLMALVMEYLSDIAKVIRDDDSNSYRLFWNPKDGRGCAEPKPETECRNVLMAFLKERLSPLGLRVSKEDVHVDDKRADLEISFGQLALPIEIKRDSEKGRGKPGDPDYRPNLWHAIQDQLIPRYTRRPDTGGFGIYLVFWFGQGNIPPAPDGLPPPRKAQELEDRLRATLEPDDRLRIQVCVIDCACPG